jgi:hydrogenase expression/formation protein HypD
MKILQGFQDPALVEKLLERVRKLAVRPVVIMEVCGTHTMEIFRTGLRSLLPDRITLLSGPGCPVCVTSQGEIDAFVSAAGREGLILATFGDLVRVPGTRGSLQEARAGGADVRVVYSSLDALDLARKNPEREVVFCGVGFETTAPTVAGALQTARAEGLGNFTVFSAHKRVPPALDALFRSGMVRVDGLLCPGHVSVIIGEEAYRPVAERYRVPCVITGFEPVDILQGIVRVLGQVQEKRACVENAYGRAVTRQGNRKALDLMDRVFRVGDAVWRGLGTLAESGFLLQDEYAGFDARLRHGIEIVPAPEPPGCVCGAVLTGRLLPPDCRLFRNACTPEHPVGPCMVSSEGTCAAYHRYHEAR